jgi:ABC-type bacteriocin/lantibiotic exporter with double-glycine peptidase domain
MTSEETNSKQTLIAPIVYRFFGGAALGAFMVAIPISYESPIDVSIVEVGVALLLVISCGFLSVIWGEKFIEAVAKVLNNISL